MIPGSGTFFHQSVTGERMSTGQLLRLNLPRKSVVRLTDRLQLFTVDVKKERKNKLKHDLVVHLAI